MRGPSGLLPLKGNDFPNRYVTTLGAKFIMSFFGFLSIPDSQNFALSRRELLGKSLAIGAAISLLPEPQPKSSYPLPEFNIGDLVASDWEPDDDDAPERATDYGEILGMRWLPQAEGSWNPAHTWVYYVYWTHGTCGSDICYPCYDGASTRACDLRLVSAEEICKH
jgi:hypothetical protein